MQVRVVGQSAAKCRFWKRQLLRQSLDLIGVWKPVSSYKLMNRNEGRVASSMGFKNSAYAVHLRSHNTIVGLESWHGHGGVHLRLRKRSM